MESENLSYLKQLLVVADEVLQETNPDTMQVLQLAEAIATELQGSDWMLRALDRQAD